MLSRRSFLASAPAVLARERRPNVVVFMSDQESALLPGPVRLPNRERMNASGVQFANAFANTPQCSAARSSLLTGLEQHRTGVLTNVDASSLGRPLSPTLPNIAQVFRGAGYRTGYFGKWHLGKEDGGLEEFGFEKHQLGRDQVVSDAAAGKILRELETRLNSWRSPQPRAAAIRGVCWKQECCHDPGLGGHLHGRRAKAYHPASA